LAPDGAGSEAVGAVTSLAHCPNIDAMVVSASGDDSSGTAVTLLVSVVSFACPAGSLLALGSGIPESPGLITGPGVIGRRSGTVARTANGVSACDLSKMLTLRTEMLVESMDTVSTYRGFVSGLALGLAMVA
jgi:hypothetical protein